MAQSRLAQHVVTISLIGASAFYLFYSIFKPGFLYTFGGGLSQHFAESVYVTTVLLPNYHQIIGWNPFLYLGYAQGLFNPPGGYILYMIFYYPLSTFLSQLDIYKVMLAFVLIVPGLSLYFTSRVFGMSKLTGFFAALAVIDTSGGYEQSGPMSILHYGTWQYATATALIPANLALYYLFFKSRSVSTSRSTVFLLLSGLFSAAIFILHTIAGIYLVALMVIFTLVFVGKQIITTRRRAEMLRILASLGIILLIFVGVSSFWIFPAYADRAYYLMESASLSGEQGSISATYHRLITGGLFGSVDFHLSSLHFGQFLVLFAIVGIGISLWKRGSRVPMSALLLCTLSLLYFSLGPSYYGASANNNFLHIDFLRSARAAATIRIFLALFAGVGLGETFHTIFRMKRVGKAVRGFPILKVVAAVLVIIIALSFAGNSIYILRHASWLTAASQYSGEQDSVPQLMDWLRQNVPNSTRVVFEDYPGEPQLLSLSMLYTGKGEIGSDYSFWWPGANSSNAIALDMFNNSEFDSSTMNTLKGLNAGYIVAWSNQSKAELHNNNQSVSLAGQIGFFSVFKLRDYTPSYVSLLMNESDSPFSSGDNATIVDFQPETLVIHLSNVSAGSELVVKMEYYHDWKAYSSSGETLAVEPLNQSLPLLNVSYIGVNLSDSGSYNVTLQYVKAGADTAGLVITLVSLTVVGVVLLIFAVDRSERNPLIRRKSTKVQVWNN